MLATSMTWPMDMLSAANHAAKKLCPDNPPFQLVTTACNKGQVLTHSPFSLFAETSITDINNADIREEMIEVRFSSSRAVQIQNTE